MEKDIPFIRTGYAKVTTDLHGIDAHFEIKRDPKKEMKTIYWYYLNIESNVYKINCINKGFHPKPKMF
mgnify:CR=1 FL=1